MAASPDRTRRPLVVDEAVAILTRTPATLDALLRGLPAAWTTAHEGGETWSPFDVLGHLIHGEKTDWMARVRHIRDKGDAEPFAPVNRQAQVGASDGRALDSLLDEFARRRRDSLDELAAMRLTPRDLTRSGLHPALGPVTLGQLLATWAAHDLDHVTQIARVLARQYTDAVGPWQAYLRVINGTPV
jgi:hypothetical protein